MAKPAATAARAIINVCAPVMIFVFWLEPATTSSSTVLLTFSLALLRKTTGWAAAVVSRDRALLSESSSPSSRKSRLSHGSHNQGVWVDMPSQ